MNGLERMMTAINLGVPDRVPHFELAYNEAPIINIARHFTDDLPEINYVQKMDIEDKVKLFEAILLLVKELDVDGISLRILSKTEPVDDIRVKDDWGVTFQLSPAGDAMVVDGPIKDESDLKNYTPPKLTEMDMLSVSYGASRYKGEKAIFLVTRCPFRMSWNLLGGTSRLLLYYRRKPHLVHDIARIVTDYLLEGIDMAVKLGVDVIALDGDLAYDSGPFMSPVQFQEFVMPYYREVVERSHSFGVKIVKHTDGDFWKLLPDFIDAGFDGIHPIQPQCMDIGEVKQKVGSKVSIMGNIDCMYTLTRGSTQDVEEEVKRTIEVASPGGGYIITSSNSIHPDVKPENYIAMVKAAHTYGVYDGDRVKKVE